MRETPHSRDLRKGRFSEAGRIYLVTTATYDRRPIFSDFTSGRIVVQSLWYQATQDRADTLAYVVMPDHLHWLLALAPATDLSRVVRATKGLSARRVNLRLGRSGAILWQSGFHDHALRQEEDIRDAARYIVANPLRAGLVRRLGDYPLWDAVWL